MKRRDTKNPIVIESPYKTVKATIKWAANKIRHKKYEVQILVGSRIKKKPLVAIITQFNPKKVAFRSTIMFKLAARGAKDVFFLHNHPSSASLPSVGDLENVEELCRISKVVGVKLRQNYIVSSKQRLLTFREGYRIGLQKDKIYYSSVVNKEYQL